MPAVDDFPEPKPVSLIRHPFRGVDELRFELAKRPLQLIAGTRSCCNRCTSPSATRSSSDRSEPGDPSRRSERGTGRPSGSCRFPRHGRDPTQPAPYRRDDRPMRPPPEAHRLTAGQDGFSYQQRNGIGVRAAWCVVCQSQVRHTGRRRSRTRRSPSWAGSSTPMDRGSRLAGGNRSECALEAIEKIATVEIADGNDERIRRMIVAAVVLVEVVSRDRADRTRIRSPCADTDERGTRTQPLPHTVRSPDCSQRPVARRGSLFARTRPLPVRRAIPHAIRLDAKRKIDLVRGTVSK